MKLFKKNRAKETIEIALKEKIDFLSHRYSNILGDHPPADSSIESIADNIATYYESIIACMPGNVYWLDTKGRGIGCNKNVLNMFGFTSMGQFRGLTFEDMGIAGNWDNQATISFKKDTMEVVRTGEAKLNVEEPPIPHSDGRILYFLSSRVPLFGPQGNVVGVVGISIDITDRKIKEQLEKERIVANEKIAYLRELGGIIAHELRTPLGAILLNRDLMEAAFTRVVEAALNNNPEFYNKYIADNFAEAIKHGSQIDGVIKRTSTTINLILNNIKEEKISTKRFHKAAIDDDIKSVLSSYPFTNQEEQLVHYDENHGFHYFGNSDLTQLILTNLLKNALYHINLEQKGKIYIYFKSDDNNNYLIFRDTGPGIPAELLPHVFDRFVSGRCGGTGLGLSFCKAVMESYQGDIACDSKEGEYTEFTLTFPKMAQT